MTVLNVVDLRKEFTVRGSSRPLVAVGGVSFTIGRGETLGLVGESGSGKTTVGRIIMGLQSLTSGSITFNDQDIGGLATSERRELARSLQMVFQDPADSLEPRYTVARIVAEPLSIGGVPRAERDQIVARALVRSGLSLEVFHRYPHELSAGAQQKVALARAIVGDPKLLVLDEPTSALDVRSRRELLSLIRHLQEEVGLSTLFISHDLTAISSIANTIAVMYLGRIVEYGRTEQVFANPRHPYTQALLASVPYPDPERVKPARVRLTGEIPSPINIPSGCPLRGRCPRAIQECASIQPPLAPSVSGQLVACLLEYADEISGAGNADTGSNQQANV